MAEARAHSLAQLKLLMRAAERRQAGQGLIDLQVTVAGVAASMSKEGNRLVERVQGELKKRL